MSSIVRTFLLFIFCIGLIFNGLVKAQSLMKLPLNVQAYDECQMPLKEKNESINPKKATVLSAIIPGLGQIYNEKYWKVGIIYGAGIAMGYGMKFNSDSLKRYQQALNYRIDTSSLTVDNWYPLLSDAKVQGERDYYRKNRDMLIIGFIGLYAIQIIDANVDAHLKEFEINEDLAIKITPDFRLYGLNQFGTGLSVRLRF